MATIRVLAPEDRSSTRRLRPRFRNDKAKVLKLGEGGELEAEDVQQLEAEGFNLAVPLNGGELFDLGDTEDMITGSERCSYKVDGDEDGVDDDEGQGFLFDVPIAGDLESVLSSPSGQRSRSVKQSFVREADTHDSFVGKPSSNDDECNVHHSEAATDAPGVILSLESLPAMSVAADSDDDSDDDLLMCRTDTIVGRDSDMVDAIRELRNTLVEQGIESVAVSSVSGWSQGAASRTAESRTASSGDAQPQTAPVGSASKAVMALRRLGVDMARLQGR